MTQTAITIGTITLAYQAGVYPEIVITGPGANIRRLCDEARVLAPPDDFTTRLVVDYLNQELRARALGWWKEAAQALVAA